MLYNDRAAFILQQLQLKSTVKVTEIAKSLNVSVDTVRRDLKARIGRYRAPRFKSTGRTGAA